MKSIDRCTHGLKVNEHSGEAVVSRQTAPTTIRVSQLRPDELIAAAACENKARNVNAHRNNTVVPCIAHCSVHLKYRRYVAGRYSYSTSMTWELINIKFIWIFLIILTLSCSRYQSKYISTSELYRQPAYKLAKKNAKLEQKQ